MKYPTCLEQTNLINTYKLFPNQEDTLCLKGNLYQDMGIEEAYKPFVTGYGYDIKKVLLVRDINTGGILFSQKSMSDVFDEMITSFKVIELGYG